MSIVSDIFGEDLGSIATDFGRSFLNFELLKKQVGLQTQSQAALNEQAFTNFLEQQEVVQKANAKDGASISSIPLWAKVGGGAVALGLLLFAVLRK